MEDNFLHGQILRQTEQVKAKRSWDWLKKGDWKKETEGLITATQDPALRTNVIKTSIEKQDVSPLCRLCGDKDATRNHLICECSKMDYPQRHNNVAKIIHQDISKKHIQ